MCVHKTTKKKKINIRNKKENKKENKKNYFIKRKRKRK